MVTDYYPEVNLMENLPVVHTKKFCCKFRSGRKAEEARYSKPALYIYI